MDELVFLLRLRPVLLALFYGLLCLFAIRVPGPLSPYVLLPLAAALLFVSFPMMNLFGFRLPAALREFINAITVSQLGLTFNLGGLILGFGLFQHLKSNK
ncbi:MAG: hypothetical protein KIT08_08425 [Anaerolineales bacterium]|nr:MAG: hypothetical protein KIT08_08425 [Anaerolineales bacterium]